MITEEIRLQRCMTWIGSVIGAAAQVAGEQISKTDLGSNLAQIGFGQLNSSLNARRQWKYYQRQAALDHQYNLQTMDYAADIARDQYDYEYQMESPSARVQQLRMAGLNKGLMYSSNGQGMQGAVSSGSPVNSKGSMPVQGQSYSPPPAIDMASGIASLAQMKQVSINAGIAEKDIALKEKELAIRELDRLNRLIENESDDEQLKILKAAKKDIIEKYSADLEVTRKTSSKLDKEIENLDALTDKAIVETGLIKEKVNTEKLQQTVLRMSAKKIDAEIDRFAKQNELSDAEIATLNEQMSKYKEDAKYQRMINESIQNSGFSPTSTGLTGPLERFLAYLYRRVNSESYSD